MVNQFRFGGQSGYLHMQTMLDNISPQLWFVVQFDSAYYKRMDHMMPGKGCYESFRWTPNIYHLMTQQKKA